MDTTGLKFAHLDQHKISRLQAIEAEMNLVLVAFEPVLKYADLSIEQLDQIQKLEKELDLTLVAFD